MRTTTIARGPVNAAYTAEVAAKAHAAHAALSPTSKIFATASHKAFAAVAFALRKTFAVARKTKIKADT